ncbi:MAG: ABC transporter permease [Phycisphaerales bacterium]
MSSHATMRKVFQYGLLAALLAVFGLFLIYPIWLTVEGGFKPSPGEEGFTLRHLKLVFMDPVLVAGLRNAFLIAVGTTTLSIAIALPLAVLSAKYRYPFKSVWNSIILVPLILPPFVGAIGLQAIMGREGTINTIFGTSIDFLGNQSTKFWMVVLIQALHLYPIIYLNATAALANLDPALDEAAENLGIGPWKRFFKITLPLIRPGLFAGSTIVFIWAFTELGTPLMLNFYTVTPVQIFSGIKEVTTSAQPYALTVVMLVAAIGMYVLGKLVFGGKAYAMYAKASRR